MDKSADALSYIKMNGPVLPVKVSKCIKTNILMASAVLSELVSSKKIKISNASIGGSPLYYVEGQEDKLQQLLGERLTDKRREAYNLLKEKQILQESKLEPVIRFALKDIKDFAVPLDVTFNAQTQRFWKWYLTSNEIAKDLVEELISGKPKEKIIEPKIIAPIPIEVKLPEPKVVKVRVKKIEPKAIEIKEEIQEVIEEPKEVIEKIGFYKNVDDFFRQNNVNVLNEELVKRDREFNLVIEIPSPLGNLKYFVKVRNIKKVTDAELSLAYSQAQMQQLPLLFLTNGELTKGAKLHLDKNLKGVVYKKF